MTLVMEKKTLTVEKLAVRGYEKVLKITDSRSGLKAIICLHNLTLGPALGGTRIYPYASWDEALTDATRLARGMTYKSALAQTGLGGGKSVIIADPKKDKTPGLLMDFGLAVNDLKGEYICAEDSGCTCADMAIIRQSTPYVVGLEHEKSSGNPSYFTAWGVFRAIQSAMMKLFGSDSVKDRTIAIQGLGSVGMILAETLFWHGAKLVVTDIDQTKVQQAVKEFSAKSVSLQEIYSVPCDIFAPCALGAIINTKTIPQLRTRAIVGAANNQLLNDSDADDLMKCGILYAPDFVANAGGLINVTQELEPEGYVARSSWQKTDSIYDQLLSIYDISEKNRISTHAAAIALGDLRLKYGIGQRRVPVQLHHAN